MEQFIDLLQSFNPIQPSFPPTELYNEGWLLRIILDWFSKNNVNDFPLGFSHGAGWFSEALLPSPFLPRYRGDPLAESRTHADGVIGHIIIGEEGKADLTLAPRATQFAVLEAKISSPLSSGTKNAPYYDQAARNVDCIAEVLRRVDCPPGEISELGFHVLAPESKIQSGVFDKEVNSDSITWKVRKRTSEYDGERDEWFTNWFVPVMDYVNIGVLSWENIIAGMREDDPKAADTTQGFYELCLEFN